MSVKIQIASLDALERLIGGDNQLEIEVRESVVQNFAIKHLKSLVGPVMDNYTSRFAKMLKDEVKTQINEKSRYGSYDETKLNDALKKQISEIIRAEFLSEVRSAARIEVNRIVDEIESEIKKTMIKEQIDFLVNERAKAMVRSLAK